MKRFAAATALVSTFVLCGCSSESLGDSAQVDDRDDGIINGTLDSTHQAVVALFGNQSACTATIVAVNGNFGYALTAAHCVTLDTPQGVVQGNDYNSGSAIGYPIVDYDHHPNYDPQSGLFDFGMVKFTGAGAATPVIQPMTAAEDNLSVGDFVNIIGYGLTQNGPTSKRYHISLDLDNVSALLLEYTQQNGGPCSGDSGGPAISMVGGQERVSGVTAFGDQNCNQFGASGRVSAVYSGFIKPFIDGGGGGGLTCDQCIEASTSGVGSCVDEVNACYNNNDCASMLQCFDGCGNDQNCVQDCANQHPTGLQVYFGIIDCLCDTACVAECGSEPFCQSGSSTTAAAATTNAAATTATSGTTDAATTGSATTGVGVGGAGATSDVSAGVGGDETPPKKKKSSNAAEDETGGCGCRVPATAPDGSGRLALIGAALAAAAVRRRRARRGA